MCPILAPVCAQLLHFFLTLKCCLLMGVLTRLKLFTSLILRAPDFPLVLKLRAPVFPLVLILRGQFKYFTQLDTASTNCVWSQSDNTDNAGSVFISSGYCGHQFSLGYSKLFRILRALSFFTYLNTAGSDYQFSYVICYITRLMSLFFGFLNP